MHFFKSIRIFNVKLVEERVEFICKICSVPQHAKFPLFTNLNSHLNKHPDFLLWKEQYKLFKNIKEAIIDDRTYDIIRYIISSNKSFAHLKNPYFRKLIETPNMKIPSYRSFRNDLFPSVYNNLLNAINSKLMAAQSVCLVVDIWTNTGLADFIGLAAMITKKFGAKEACVIGMMKMPG